jgi:hypothetical protein
MELDVYKTGWWIMVRREGGEETPSYMRMNTETDCCWYMNTSGGFLIVDSEKARELEDALVAWHEKLEKGGLM